MAMSRSLGGRSLTSRSPMRSSPDVMVSRPATMRRAVDLPQPDGPTSTRNSPSSMLRSMSTTAVTPLGYTLVSLSIVTAATGTSLIGAPSALHRAGQQAPDEVALEREEHGERQGDRHERRRGQQMPVLAPAARQAGQPHRHRRVLAAGP